MNNTKIFLFIGIFILFFLIVILAIITGKKFDFDSINLEENNEFYEKHKDATLKYLVAVYPNGKESLEKLNAIDLAKFYNSLWFYYNCESSFKGNLPTDQYACWQTLPGCGDKYPKLPYTPQGYFYSIKDWVKNWTPWIKATSDMEPSYFTMSLPGSPIFPTYNGTMFAGPGPLFMYQRGLYRMVYNTEIPKLSVFTDGYGNDHEVRLPKTTPNTVKPEWKIPNNWWKGAEDNNYIEVTGADEPGMPISGCAVWIDGWRGSGIFYNVGRSLRCRNKVDAVWLLAKEMSQKYPDVLKDVYSTIDPYDIVSVLFEYPCKQKAPTVWDSEKSQKVQCNWCMGAGGAIGGIPQNNTGFSSAYFFEPADWYSWCGKKQPSKSKNRLYGVPNECIDDIRFNRNALGERISAQGPFDEGMTWMGIYLGYDTIQESQSSNGNGYYQVEILELRNYPESVKNRDYSEYIQKIPGTNCNNSPNNVEWRTDTPFLKNFMAKIYQYYSIRDPLDINNDSKASKCIPGKKYDYNLNSYNITCKNNLSDMFTDLDVFDSPSTNLCPPNGAGTNGKKMVDKNSMPYG